MEQEISTGHFIPYEKRYADRHKLKKMLDEMEREADTDIIAILEEVAKKPKKP